MLFWPHSANSKNSSEIKPSGALAKMVMSAVLASNTKSAFNSKHTQT
jgi:hypothetical protein